MRLKEKLKKSLELCLRTKIITVLIVACLPSPSLADPVVAGELLPPATAVYITDPQVISMLGLDSIHDPVWCYTNQANAMLITAKEREKEKCQLRLQQEIEKQKAIFDLRLETLTAELNASELKFAQIVKIKNEEIKKLEEIATNKPNEYSAWWATGGFVAGMATTIAVVYALR
tara:strand:- start:9276 stop:9797 length:522 start_codon:yes stop_codon:yes gene_type:complete